MPDDPTVPIKVTIEVRSRDLGDVANRFTDKLAVGFKKLYEPTHTRRMAKAKADANMIQAKADIERLELEHKAWIRIRGTETRRQENIQAIVDESTKHIPNVVDENELDPDWMAEFINGCQDIGSEKLQQLWGKLLAQEVASPQSISKRTILFLRTMSSDDALLFASICPRVWSDGEEGIITYSERKRDDIVSTQTFGDLMKKLEKIGLLTPSVRVATNDFRAYVECNDNKYFVRHVGTIMAGAMLSRRLTEAGNELYRIARIPPSIEYETATIGFLKENGAVIQYMKGPMQRPHLIMYQGGEIMMRIDVSAPLPSMVSEYNEMYSLFLDNLVKYGHLDNKLVWRLASSP